MVGKLSFLKINGRAELKETVNKVFRSKTDVETRHRDALVHMGKEHEHNVHTIVLRYPCVSWQGRIQLLNVAL